MNTKVTTLDDVNDILGQVRVREAFIPMRNRSGSREVYSLEGSNGAPDGPFLMSVMFYEHN